MRQALLVDYYLDLPELAPGDDPEMWGTKMQEAMRLFRRRLRDRYSEPTLARLLDSTSFMARRAAVLALGLVGSYHCNAALAKTLHDSDLDAAKMASDALWEVWMRGGSDQQNSDLTHILRLPETRQTLAGLDDLVKDAPNFAEAINQRAIVHFQHGDFRMSAADCKRAVELNPHHFGALAGLGQCYMKLRKPRAALRAFRQALQINPTLSHLTETIRSLQRTLGGEEGIA